jgi:hypothetical protein
MDNGGSRFDTATILKLHQNENVGERDKSRELNQIADSSPLRRLLYLRQLPTRAPAVAIEGRIVHTVC